MRYKLNGYWNRTNGRGRKVIELNLVTAIADTANTIRLTFNAIMADPTDKEDEFGVSVGGGGSTSDYQEWENYPDSLDLTSEYPYQLVITNGSVIFLAMCKNYMYVDLSNEVQIKITSSDSDINSPYIYYRILSDNEWGSRNVRSTLAVNIYYYMVEANHDVYNEYATTSVYFAQTTSSSTALTIASITQPSSKVYQLNISETMLDTDTITATYTKGTVESSAGVDLEDFSQSVTNNIT